MDTKDRHADAEQFFRDIALCVATYRDSGPAVVWPTGADAVAARCLPQTRREPAGQGPFAVPRAAPGPLRQVADRLAPFVGAPVSARYWDLGAGHRTASRTLEHDAVLFQVAGACECRVDGAGPQDEAGPLEHPLGVRLRAGEALYAARRSRYVLAEVYSRCTLVEFSLGG